MGFRLRGIAALVALLAVVCPRIARAADGPGNGAKPLVILCSMFPIQQITRNIVGDAPGVSLELMIPSEAGCPHEYAPTPRDMLLLARADILVINGLGMEEFLGGPVARANRNVLIVDASRDASSASNTNNASNASNANAAAPEPSTARKTSDAEEKGAVNPHQFVSPAGNARMAENIARRLTEIDPARAETYRRNAERYARNMRALAEEMRQTCARFVNRRVVEAQGVFAFLARDIGLETIGTPHARAHGEELSAAAMLTLLETVRREKPAAILAEAGAPGTTEKLLVAEIGLPVILLDATAAGPENAPADYFETVMRRNLAALRQVLGTDAP